MKKIKCFHCDKMGHMKSGFLKRERSQGDKDEKKTNTVIIDGEATIVCDDSCVSLVC